MANKNQKKRPWFQRKELKDRRWQKMLKVKINNTMRTKLVGLFSVVILALVGLAFRITSINVMDGKQYERIVMSQTQQQYESRTIPFKRGDIKDRNGTILATSDKVYNLILDCKVVNSVTKDEEEKEGQFYREPTIEALVKLFQIDEKEIREILDNPKTKASQYVILAENLSISEKQKFEEYTDLKSDQNENLPDEVKKKRRRIQGIWFEEDYLRIYPMNSLACDVVGFCESDNAASYGIEGYYSDVLNGTNGRQFGYFNDDADVEQTIIDPVAGKNVISTIDVNIQQIIRSAMEKFIEKYSNGPNGEAAADNIGVIVMNPNTGEILGMDSSNWYDLNNPRLYTKEERDAMTEEEQKDFADSLKEMWKNFCVSDSFEPGSTFKPITVAAAMDTAVTDNRQTYYCDGLEKVQNAILHCVIYPDEHGELNLESALKVSCNDALMQVGRQLGASAMLKYQELFNFGMRTGIDLPGENSGVLHTEESMGEVELATTSFGQGFTCTMVQEAAAFSAVINGGYYYKPHVVSAITDSSGAVTEHVNPVVERQAISTGVSNQIRNWLGEVVQQGGSGSVARVEGYSMGGKTGTAQKVDPVSKAYEGDYLVSFIGCAPLENPEAVVYVVVDRPNAEDQATSIYAQEIAREIFIELLPYMNIFPEDPAATEAFIAQLRETEAAEKQAAEAAAQAAAQAAAEPAPAQEEQKPDESQPQPAEEAQEETAPPEEQPAENPPVLDTDIPVPEEGVQDETVENGGNGLFTDGIPNE